MKQLLPRGAPVRVGVIGTGWVATSRHIPALRADRRASLDAVLDPNQEKADATASISFWPSRWTSCQSAHRPPHTRSLCEPLCKLGNTSSSRSR